MAIIESPMMTFAMGGNGYSVLGNEDPIMPIRRIIPPKNMRIILTIIPTSTTGEDGTSQRHHHFGIPDLLESVIWGFIKK